MRCVRSDAEEIARKHTRVCPGRDAACNASSQIRDREDTFVLLMDPGSAAQHFMLHGVRGTRSVASPQPTFFSGAGADFAQ